jgi:hypothetical protein
MSERSQLDRGRRGSEQPGQVRIPLEGSYRESAFLGGMREYILHDIAGDVNYFPNVIVIIARVSRCAGNANPESTSHPQTIFTKTLAGNSPPGRCAAVFHITFRDRWAGKISHRALVVSLYTNWRAAVMA